VHRLALAALVMIACRPHRDADPRAPFDHHRDDYVSQTYAPVGVASELALQLADAAARSPTTQSLLLDERMAVVADEIAERSASGQFVALPEMFRIARESGSLLFPLQALALDPAELVDGWADAAIASIPGNGPLAIGTSTPRDGAPIVVVFARSIVRLAAPVPREGATRVEIELHPRAATMTPSLVVIGAEGTTELPMQQVAPLRFAAERAEGFAAHRVGILGIVQAPDVGRSRNTSSDLLASLHLGVDPQLGPARVDVLVDGLTALRAQWKQPKVVFAEKEAAPCGTNTLAIDGTAITLVQRCATWASAGSDAERWSAMLLNPLALMALADPQFEIAEIRRDPTSTSVRLGRRFEEMSEADALARMHELVRARFPEIHHDAAADRETVLLAEAWAAESLDGTSIEKHAKLTADAASRWTKQPRWYRVTWSDQDLDDAIRAVEPDAPPVDYTLGIVRGTGPQGEPRWFMVLLLSLPRA
jgi:hypothetical protein